VVDNAIEPAGASGRWRQNALGKALREDLTPAQNRVATEAAGNHHELNDTPRQRQICHAAAVMTMNAARDSSARGTKTKAASPSDDKNGLFCFKERTFYNKLSRHQIGAAKCLLHGADPPQRERHTNPKLHQM
jgi:hypothetical protein